MEPLCGPRTATPIPGVPAYLFGLLLLVIGAIEVAVVILGVPGLIEGGLGVVLFTLFGYGFTAATVLPVLAAVVAALAAVAIVGAFYFDRCGPVVEVPVVGMGTFGMRECMSGVVEAVFDATGNLLTYLAPYAAMHDRVDLVTKSRYWPAVERGEAFVHCTGELPPRRAEIIRCYFYSAEVCNAGLGALIGVIIGAVVGVIAAILVVLAIMALVAGCSTWVFCVLGAIVAAALVAFAAAMVGATVGGLIGLFASPDSSPTPTQVDTDGDGVPDATASPPAPIVVGDLLTVIGMVYPRADDDGANVFWRLGADNEPPEEASLVVQHGNLGPGAPRPFSHLDVDDNELFPDACPV